MNARGFCSLATLSLLVLQRLVLLHFRYRLQRPGGIHPGVFYQGKPEFLFQGQLIDDPRMPVHVLDEPVIGQHPLRESFREIRGEFRVTLLEVVKEDLL